MKVAFDFNGILCSNSTSVSSSVLSDSLRPYGL